MNNRNQIKGVVAQKGAREHYLIARSLYSKKMLALLVVDWYPKFLSNGIIPIIGIKNNAFLRASSAYCQSLPDDLVVSRNFHGICYRIRSKLANRRNVYKVHLKNDAHFSNKVNKLRLPDHNVIICYSYAALEALRHAKKNGKLAVLVQIDPGPLERLLVVEEEKKWPQYVTTSLKIDSEYERRVTNEWEIADVIIVNSEWSAKQLMQQGVPNHKIEVLPLAYERPLKKIKNDGTPDKWTRTRKLRVLWLGQVILRKGIQYLVEAAQALSEEPVEFLVAGPIDIPHKILSNAPDNIQWFGNIPRSQVEGYYQMADIFVLPTISDGFAITQIEALSFGLPVIVTPNCARVVGDGKSGFVIPPSDSAMLAEAVKRFIENPELIHEMKPHCYAISKDYTLDAHSRKLERILCERISLKT
jgi:glycosyltransferase involved in cell wall biosynthesis